jgi:hypothetical protein
MAYITSPGFGMLLADPSTVQIFETSVVNADFLALENGILVERARIDAQVVITNAYTAGVGRGNLAREVTATPATLTAIADPLVGDRVRVAAPGTGITAFWVECIAGAGAATADWVPVETVIADTKTNLDAFIAAWVADADLTFAIGQRILVTGTGITYRITSTAGALTALPGVIKPAAPTLGGAGAATVNADGTVSLAATATSVAFDGCFDETMFHRYKVTIEISATSTANQISIFLRDAAAATIGTGYDAELVVGSGASASTQQQANATTGWTAYIASASARTITLWLHAISVAAFKTGRMDLTEYAGASQPLTASGSIGNRGATAARGFLISVNTGTFTGLVTIEGIK